MEGPRGLCHARAHETMRAGGRQDLSMKRLFGPEHEGAIRMPGQHDGGLLPGRDPNPWRSCSKPNPEGPGEVAPVRAGVIRGMEGQGRQNLCMAVTWPASDAGAVTAGRCWNQSCR